MCMLSYCICPCHGLGRGWGWGWGWVGRGMIPCCLFAVFCAISVQPEVSILSYEPDWSFHFLCLSFCCSFLVFKQLKYCRNETKTSCLLFPPKQLLKELTFLKPCFVQRVEREEKQNRNLDFCFNVSHLENERLCLAVKVKYTILSSSFSFTLFSQWVGFFPFIFSMHWMSRHAGCVQTPPQAKQQRRRWRSPLWVRLDCVMYTRATVDSSKPSLTNPTYSH